MFHSFKVLWDHRKMLWATTLADIQSRYAGSVLGMFWLVIYPILMLTAYSVVYVFIFQVRLEQITTPQYVMLIFSGLIPFLGFSEGFGNSVISVTSNASLVKNTLYPIELIPVKAVLFSQCTEVVGLILLTVAVAVTGLLSPWLLLALPLWSFQVIFGIGVGWLISSINVVLRDMQSLINIISLMLMMISPIAYTPDMIPAGLRPFLRLNPLYYFITAYQHCFIYGEMPPRDILVAVVLISLGTFLVGFWVFEKMKQLFDDNI